MNKKLNINTVDPLAIQAMISLERYLDESSISPTNRELIAMRASQINGCIICSTMHISKALSMGETHERIHMLPLWRKSNLFTDDEKILLALTESITMIHQQGIPEDIYQNALNAFGEKNLMQFIMAIVTINAWNRVTIATDM